MKTLCFTTSYNRPYYIYNIINNILNQSYTDINYAVNINIDNDDEKLKFEKLLQDFLPDSRLKLVFNYNKDQHTNYLRAINAFNSLDYDLFIKIDDDDIYYKNYIEKSIAYFRQHECDILSYSATNHINNGKIKGLINSIGQWNGDINSNIKFGMPPTYIFNKKACDIILKITPKDVKSIHAFEDCAWRTFWRKANLKSVIIDNDDIFQYNIHNKNISSTFLLEANNPISLIENNHFCIVFIESNKWKSYVYLNKRNKRLYHINNDDHGSYTISHNKLIIKWDDWGTEEFIKHKINDQIYIYKLVK
jgi:hypothetical protein